MASVQASEKPADEGTCEYDNCHSPAAPWSTQPETVLKQNRPAHQTRRCIESKKQQNHAGRQGAQNAGRILNRFSA